MNKSIIMSTSHKFYLMGFSKSESLRLAWSKHKIINKLRSGVVRFEFLKKSTSEIRFAVGTLRNDLFEYTYKGDTRKENPMIVKYFDYIKGRFRSFRVDGFIGIL